MMRNYEPIRQVVMNALEKIEEASRQNGRITGLKTGFDDLDNILSGLQPGSYNLIGARPSMGKTALALNIAMNVAIEEKKKVIFFSLEMSKEQVEKRLFVMNAEKNNTLLYDNLIIDDTPGISICELRKKCHEYSLKKGLDLIIIDYLQLMSGETDNQKKYQGRVRELADISMGINEIAKELQVPVIVLTQLPRDVERRDDFRPQLGYLREYGTTEQDSDVVLFIYRDDYYNKKSIKQNIAEIIVAKNRYGERNKVINLKWDKEYLRFQNYKESEMNKSNIWLDGIMGVVVGDALGVPVEFKERQELRNDPVETMRGYGSFNLPAGSWSDDTSMTLATLDSLKNGFNRHDIMRNFIQWIRQAEYTPFGNVFDVGNICYRAIAKYELLGDIEHCGCDKDYENGNGSLMRILSACLYFYQKQKEEGMSDEEAIKHIHSVSALTHAHIRSLIACGLYYFMIKSILDNEGTLMERLQIGVNAGFYFYKSVDTDADELNHFKRIRDLKEFSVIPEDDIRSTGYVLDTLEAAVWCLINTDSYKTCTLKAVNLGDDTDTVSAITGGLAGLYYGYRNIPKEWLNTIQKREWIEGMCDAKYCTN